MLICGLTDAKGVVEQVGSVKGKQKPKEKRKRERSAEEMVGVLWMVIDEAKSSMYDPLTSSEERRHWAKV